MRTYKDTCREIADVAREYVALRRRADDRRDPDWELGYAFAGIAEALRADALKTYDRGYVPMAASFSIVGAAALFFGQIAPESMNHYRTFATAAGIGMGIAGAAMIGERVIRDKPYHLLDMTEQDF